MSKKHRQRRASSAENKDTADVLVDRLLHDLGQALATGDLLTAEVATARALTIGEEGDDRPAEGLIHIAAGSHEPDDAALLRLIASLGSPAVKRTAGQVLATLTQAGVYPAEWASEVGKVTPGQAWRQYDVFGDREEITVSYRYAAGEHALVTRIDLTTFPRITDLDLVTDTARLADDIAAAAGPFGRHEPIGLADARRRIERALVRGSEALSWPGEMLVYMPILRSRLRRLPAPPDGDGAVTDGAANPSYTAADRVAAVDAFLASPQAAEALAADEDSTRFWARVLTGYSSRTQGEPPAQVGPLKLEAILHGFVPETFTLTPAQRRHLPVAVTAWANWSAGYRGFDEAAAAYLIRDLPAVFDVFDNWYEASFTADIRAYVADLATSDADVAMLDDAAYRRMAAIPVPGERDDGELRDKLDATTADGRRAYAAEEFGECELPSGYTRERLVAQAYRVIEELWRGDPAETWERGRRLLQSGVDRHDVIHDLMETR